MPRLRGKSLDAAEQQIGQKYTRQFVEDDKDETQPGRRLDPKRRRPSLTPSLIEPVDRPVNKEWADQMAFNEELVTIRVHESTDKFAENPVEVFCNGIAQRFLRGQDQVVKRKYVEVLARAKMTTYGNQKITIGDGEESYVYPSHTALRYPFAVVEDQNPKGRDWLKSVLAEG